MIKVRFYGIACEYAGIREWQTELNTESRIEDLLFLIMKEYPALKDLIYNGEAIREFLSISINNADILGLDGIDTLLKDGDLVFVMPPIGGG